MTDRELLLLRTAALDRVAKRLSRIRALALEAQQRRGLVLADDLLVLTDHNTVPNWH